MNDLQLKCVINCFQELKIMLIICDLGKMKTQVMKAVQSVLNGRNKDMVVKERIGMKAFVSTSYAIPPPDNWVSNE